MGGDAEMSWTGDETKKFGNFEFVYSDERVLRGSPPFRSIHARGLGNLTKQDIEDLYCGLEWLRARSENDCDTPEDFRGGYGYRAKLSRAELSRLKAKYGEGGDA